MKQSLLLAALAVLAAATALPHHSNVAFEVEKVITVTGVVKEFKWTNPHTWIILTVDDKGTKYDFSAEGRAPGVLIRSGWSRSSLKPGDKVSIDLSPAKDGSKSGLVARVVKGDGTVLGNAPPPTE